MCSNFPCDFFFGPHMFITAFTHFSSSRTHWLSAMGCTRQWSSHNFWPQGVYSPKSYQTLWWRETSRVERHEYKFLQIVSIDSVPNLSSPGFLTPKALFTIQLLPLMQSLSWSPLYSHHLTQCRAHSRYSSNTCLMKLFFGTHAFCLNSFWLFLSTIWVRLHFSSVQLRPIQCLFISTVELSLFLIVLWSIWGVHRGSCRPSNPRPLSISFSTLELKKSCSPSAFHPLQAGMHVGPLPRLCLEWHQLHRICEIFAPRDPEVLMWVGSAGTPG